MKRIGLTLLTAFVGGAMALGTYKVIEKKYADNMSFDDKQNVYFASNHLSSGITSSAGEVDFTQAAAAVTPAVVYIKTTYSNTSQNSQQGPPATNVWRYVWPGQCPTPKRAANGVRFWRDHFA
jgi:serine protease Do